MLDLFTHELASSCRRALAAAQVGLGSLDRFALATRNGVVQLSGFVDSVMEQEAALKTARSVPGVREVRNDLDLREADRSAEQAANDGVIEAKVKRRSPRTFATT